MLPSRSRSRLTAASSARAAGADPSYPTTRYSLPADGGTAFMTTPGVQAARRAGTPAAPDGSREQFWQFMKIRHRARPAAPGPPPGHQTAWRPGLALGWASSWRQAGLRSVRSSVNGVVTHSYAAGSALVRVAMIASSSCPVVSPAATERSRMTASVLAYRSKYWPGAPTPKDPSIRTTSRPAAAAHWGIRSAVPARAPDLST